MPLPGFFAREKMKGAKNCNFSHTRTQYANGVRQPTKDVAFDVLMSGGRP